MLCSALQQEQQFYFNKPEIYNSINRAFLLIFFGYAGADTYNSKLKNIIDTLLKKKPASVSKWAEEAHIVSRHLQDIWNKCLKYPPHLAIIIHKLYLAAFTYYTEKCAGSEQSTNLSIQKNRADQLEKINSLCRQYLRCKVEIDDIISG